MNIKVMHLQEATQRLQALHFVLLAAVHVESSQRINLIPLINEHAFWKMEQEQGTSDLVTTWNLVVVSEQSGIR